MAAPLTIPFPSISFCIETHITDKERQARGVSITSSVSCLCQ